MDNTPQVPPHRNRLGEEARRISNRSAPAGADEAGHREIIQSASLTVEQMAAFTIFFEKEMLRLVGFCRYGINAKEISAADAYDLAQAVMVKAYSLWPTLELPRHWVYTVARRQGFALLKARTRERKANRMWLHSSNSSPDGSLARWVAQDRLQTLIHEARLTDRQALVMQLTYAEFKPAEIAEIIGVKGESVRAILHAARKKIASLSDPR